MKANEFDFDILRKALSKIPDDFRLEQIVFYDNSFKILASIDTHSDFALKRADELLEIQLYYKQKMGD